MCPRICFKKFWLICLIALITIAACTSASASGAQEKAGFNFMQYYKQSNNMNGTGYYVLSESELGYSANGDVVVLGGKAVFKGSITGNIYVAYADVTFENGASINGDVIFLSSNVKLENGVTHVGEVKQAVRVLSLLLRYYELSDSVVYNDTQPYYIVFLTFGLFQTLIGLVMLAFMKNFLSQGSVVLMNQTKSVLIKGLAMYFIVVALIIIFVWSVVGFPIALLICFIYIIMVYMGQVSLAIAIGLVTNLSSFSRGGERRIAERAEKHKKPKDKLMGFYKITSKLFNKNNVYIFFIAGTVFIELIKLLPFLNIIINFIILPVVCFGIIAATLLNTYVLRVYFSMPFLQKIDKRDLRDDKIRDIILKDIH